MLTPLRELLQADAPLWLAAGGLGIGLIFGWVGATSNFCTMGALSDVANIGDWRRLRAWVLAAVTALVATQALATAGLVDLGASMYLAPRLNWLGHSAGGFIFGVGMVLGGGCTARNLVRAGTGDLRALLTLVVTGVAAYVALGGLLAPARAALEAATAVTLPLPTQSLAALLAAGTGLGTAVATWALTGLLALGGLAFCLSDCGFRRSFRHVGSGLAVGLLVAAAWLLTGLAFDELAPKPLPPVSLTFVRPAGDTLDWLQRFTAAPMPGFGTATVVGVLIGACLTSLVDGRFRATSFAGPADTRRALGGAVLMGVGGVLALGCTIGQGVSGVSTLAAGSFLTFVAIAVGGLCGLRWLERLLVAEA